MLDKLLTWCEIHWIALISLALAVINNVASHTSHISLDINKTHLTLKSFGPTAYYSDRIAVILVSWLFFWALFHGIKAIAKHTN